MFKVGDLVEFTGGGDDVLQMTPCFATAAGLIGKRATVVKSHLDLRRVMAIQWEESGLVEQRWWPCRFRLVECSPFDKLVRSYIERELQR